MSRQYFDVTLPLTETLPTWPGEPAATISKLSSMETGGEANVTSLSTCVHYGTHMDAPLHFIKGGGGMETISLDRLIGPAQVIDAQNVPCITSDYLKTIDLDESIPRVLFKTRNSSLWNDPDSAFQEDYVAIAPDAAEMLVNAGIRLIGIDYLSVEPFHSPGFPTHKTLLAAHVAIVENLDLRSVSSGIYEMACLPIPLAEADGAPARVVLWRDD